MPATFQRFESPREQVAFPYSSLIKVAELVGEATLKGLAHDSRERGMTSRLQDQFGKGRACRRSLCQNG
jgi:hypothetical protein